MNSLFRVNMKDIRTAKIYQITNRETKDSYIGSTRNKIATRWNYHFDRLRRGIHEVRDFQKAWDESDISDWDFRILEDNIPVENQFEIELRWQELLFPTLSSKIYWQHRKHNREKLEKVVDLLKQGKIYREIARECNVSLGWITKVKEKYISSTPHILDQLSDVSIKNEQNN